MNLQSALIFGNNEYGLEIAKNVTNKYNNITIFSLDAIDKEHVLSDYNMEEVTLSDNWDILESQFDMKKSIIFCALSDEAKNIFLTISLRSTFKDVTIIALANNNEDANKLKMAGASKVIPIVETTANIITDMLKKPIITKVLHNILYQDSKLKLVQIEIKDAKCFENKYPADINWSRNHGVLVLSIIRKDKAPEFIYSSKTKHKHIENGDIFIVVGYETDILEFKKFIGGNVCQ